MISDLDFVIPDDIEITLPAKAGCFDICLESGISTRLYLTMLKYSQSTGFENNADALLTLKDIALKIIREDKRYKDMTIADLEAKVNSFVALKGLVSSTYQAMAEIVNQPSLKLPDFHVKKRGKILSNIAPRNEDHEIMTDIAFVMSHTAQTFQSIMDMPYLTFAALLKSLVLSEALKNPEYREEYELQQMREERQRIKEAIKNGTYKREKQLDLDALKRFSASL